MNSQPRNHSLQAKGWFLTYPQCPITKEDLLEALRATGSITEYVIAQEKHEDGNFHLHAFLKYEKKVTFRANKWDVAGYHGNYQVAKSWKAVERYCKKDGDYIANIDVDSAKQKKGKNNVKLATMDPLEAISSGEISLMQLPNLVKAQQMYVSLQRKKERANIPNDLVKLRHTWVFGPSNSGKTYRMKNMMTTVGEEHFFQIPYNNDWVGYLNEKYLWADEYKGQLTVQELNRICDGGAKVNTKGGTVELRWDVEVILLSNYSIRECYSKCSDAILETMYNRLKETELEPGNWV